jgi:hypothetical protein
MSRRRVLLVAAVLAVLGLAWAAWHYRPWEPIGPLTYWRLHLGVTESEVEALLSQPAGEYRPVRHIGGRTSPGVKEVPMAEKGQPREGLRHHWSGTTTPDGRKVTMRQWWGESYAIDVAFDEHGTAVGIDLSTIEFFPY